MKIKKNGDFMKSSRRQFFPRLEPDRGEGRLADPHARRHRRHGEGGAGAGDLRVERRVGMRPSLEQIEASSALPRYTLLFLPRRLGKLRVLVENTVAPSFTWAWLPMHRLQPGISMRAPAEPSTP